MSTCKKYNLCAVLFSSGGCVQKTPLSIPGSCLNALGACISEVCDLKIHRVSCGNIIDPVQPRKTRETFQSRVTMLWENWPLTLFDPIYLHIDPTKALTHTPAPAQTKSIATIIRALFEMSIQGKKWLIDREIKKNGSGISLVHNSHLCSDIYTKRSNISLKYFIFRVDIYFQQSNYNITHNIALFHFM